MRKFGILTSLTIALNIIALASPLLLNAAPPSWSQSTPVDVADTFNQLQAALQEATLNPETATAEQLIYLNELNLLATEPQSIESTRQALSDVSGEQYTNHMFTAELINRRFVRSLYDPLRNIIFNGPGCCHDVYYNCYEIDGCTFIDDDAWFPQPHSSNGWIQIGGGHTFQRHNNNASGFNSNNYQVNLGFQSTFASVWTLGIAGAYEYDKISYNLGGHNNLNSGLFGLYGLYRPEGWYILSDLVYDYSWGDIKRPIVVGSLNYQARSRPTFMDGMFYIEAGKDVCFKNFGFLMQPFLGFEVNYYAGRSVRESNANAVNLYVHKKNWTSASSRLGLHLGSTALERFNINFDIAWQYRMTSTRNWMTASFSEFGDTYTIKGVTIPRNSLDASGYISLNICEKWDLFVEVSGQRWSRGGTYNFLAGMNFSW